jgi:polyribonucleotide nucleotidyltransferase
MIYDLGDIEELGIFDGINEIIATTEGEMGAPNAAPMGLIKEGDDVAVLSDILGDEDHLGDMDFKVTGSADGVTALQMDIKISGVTKEIMRQALEQAKAGRIHILGEMAKAIAAPRGELSKYAPRITTITVKPDQVRTVIGPGGKNVRAIIEATGCAIDIEDDGRINIASHDGEACQLAIKMIRNLTQEAEVGKFYRGTVRRIMEFGAFVEIYPGTDGLVHISELDKERVRAVTDILKEGDEVVVKCIGIDKQGRSSSPARKQWTWSCLPTSRPIRGTGDRDQQPRAGDHSPASRLFFCRQRHVVACSLGRI